MEKQIENLKTVIDNEEKYLEKVSKQYNKDLTNKKVPSSLVDKQKRRVHIVNQRVQERKSYLEKLQS